MESLLPCFMSIFFSMLFALLLLFYHQLNKLKHGLTEAKKRAPEPRGAWPIIGHLPLLKGSLRHITLGALADEYGPIFTLRLGRKHRALVISSWDVAKELHNTSHMAVLSRPQLVAAKLTAYNYAMFPFAPDGPYYREMRKLATSELLSNRRLDQLKHVRIQEVQTSIKELYRTWRERKVPAITGDPDVGGEKKDCPTTMRGVTVEMKRWFGDLSLNVILRMVVGKKYFSGGAGEEEEGRRCQKAIRELFDHWGKLVMGDIIPLLGWVDGGEEKEMKRTLQEIDCFAEKWLEEHKQKKLMSADDNKLGERDFMDVMLSILDGGCLGGFDADTINKAISLSMITGGTDTVAVAMTWALVELLNNRDVLQKAQEELDTVVGKDRLVDDADISKLVFLQAVVKESLRLHPPALIPAPRLFTEECNVCGYTIPKNTWLITNLWKIHTDPRVWSDPLKFDPDRFVTTHKNVDVRGQNFELTPFGSGRRSCPAKSYALQMVHYTLATLLHAFHFRTLTDAPVDVAVSPGLTNNKVTPLPVLVSPRLSPSCYE